MRDENGTVIENCMEPHIFKFDDTYYAYGFAISREASCTEHWRPEACMPATCYSSSNLVAWRHHDPCFPSGGLGLGRIRHVLWNAKTSQYVGFSQVYGESFTVYTSKTPTGPFSFRRNITGSPHIYGNPADAAIFPDGNNAYLVYNERQQVNRSTRFTFVYQMTDDFSDIVPSSLTNTKIGRASCRERV